MLSFKSVAQNTDIKKIDIQEVSIEEKASAFQSLNAIDSSVIHNPIHRNLGEVLENNANLFVKSYGIGSLATISMRGSASSHSKLFWNGISMNSSTNGVVDLSLFPSQFLDQVQVDYGMESMRLSSGGIGGAVQINNEAVFVKRQELSLQQQFGSFARQNTTLRYKQSNAKWVFDGKYYQLNARNNFQYRDLGEEGFPLQRLSNAEVSQQSFMQSIYYRPKSSIRWEAHLWYMNSNRDIPSIFTVNNIGENQIDQSYRALFGFKKYWNKVTLDIKSSYLEDHLKYRQNSISNHSLAINRSSKTFAEIQREWNKTTLHSRLDLEINRAQQASYHSPVQRERTSLYLEVNRILAPRINLNLAIRQEWIWAEDQFFLPKIRLDYFLNEKKDMQLFLASARNLKYPSLNDLYWEFGGNPDLQAELNETVELGIAKELDWKQWKLKARSNLYYSRIDNYIQWIPTNYGYWQAQNLKDVEVKGIESMLEANWRKNKIDGALNFNHTWTQSVNKKAIHEKDESVNQQLIYIPENQVNVGFNVRYDGYSLNYMWQFVSERYVTSDNTAWLPYFQLSKITVGKEMKFKKISMDVAFSVLNLMDLEYQSIQSRPMPYRNYLISLTLKYLK